MVLLKCAVCPYQCQSTVAYLRHMKIHALGRNVTFKCPLCPYKGTKSRNFQSHVSKAHRKENEGHNVQILINAKCLVENCNELLHTLDNLKIHMKEHCDKGNEIQCPLGICPRPDNHRRSRFSKFSAFNIHLSRNHKSLSMRAGPSVSQPESSNNPQVPLPDVSVGASSDDDEMVVSDGLDASSNDEMVVADGPDEESFPLEEACFETDSVIDFIAKWYLKMEGELSIPATSVQTICEGLATIVELSQDIVKKKMIEEMKKKNIKLQDAEDVAFVALNSDPLLRTHHRNFHSYCLLTSHRRYEYFKLKFDFVIPTKESFEPPQDDVVNVAQEDLDPDDPQSAVEPDSPAQQVQPLPTVQQAVPQPEDQPQSFEPPQDDVVNVAQEDLVDPGHPQSAVEPDSPAQQVQPLPTMQQAVPQPEDQPQLKKSEVVRVPIRKSLALQLQDAHVQADVDASFEKFASPAPTNEEKIYTDFSDGSIFANHPGRSDPGIFLLFFCDAFGTTNPIGSNKDKHKTVGMYYNIGNIPPEKRSRIDVVELSQLFLEERLKVKGKGVKARKAKKAKWDEVLQSLVEELNYLHQHGIEYKDGKVPVHFLFMMGDNLGQHQIGGFSESFSGDFWCRYCEISSHQFQLDPCASLPFRTPEMFNACIEEADASKQTSCKGVKFNSILNSIANFHICNPGLPPCVAHDLFEGIVPYDMMLIIKHLISKKWFTREQLNDKIKAFPFVGLDAADKPNIIGVDSKGKMKAKLSGSAVKNWNFLRFFGLFSMDFIQDHTDPVWQLYLKLKVLCEQICAPQISESEIEVLDNNVQLYLVERKRLFPEERLKPKHHFLRHIAALIRMFGPLTRLWTLRMESFHFVLKRAARASNNFRNIPFTMAFKAQLRKCSLSRGNAYQDGFVFTTSRKNPLTSPYFQKFIESLGIPRNFILAKSVCINGIDYKTDMWLLLGKEESRLILGEIKFMYCGDDSLLFILQKFTCSVEANNMGLHEIDFFDNRGLAHLSSLKTLASFYPLPAYRSNGKKYLTLKHSPLPKSSY